MSERSKIPRFQIGPVAVDAVARQDLLGELDEALRLGRSCAAAYVNANVFELLHRDSDLAATMGRFEIVFCDGVGAMLGLRALGARIPQRMTPPDFIDDLLSVCSSRRKRVFLVGDEESLVEKAALGMERRWPGIIAGLHHGFFAAGDAPKMVGQITQSGARLVLVGMGTPRQEQMIGVLRDQAGGRVLLAVGGLFRWYSGVERRGPRWMTDHGFEWLSRLVVQPRRVAKRYFIGLPAFALRVFGYSLRGIRASQVPRPSGADPVASRSVSVVDD